MKSNYSEADIKRKFITPAILKAGWDSNTQIREEFSFTAGRIQVRADAIVSFPSGDIDTSFDPTEEPTATGNKRHKYYVNDVSVKIIGERVQYLDQDGKLVIESYKDFTSKAVKERYRTLNEFLNRWSSEKRKKVIVQELEE